MNTIAEVYYFKMRSLIDSFNDLDQVFVSVAMNQ